MDISISCAACGTKGRIEDEFEPRGKYNGYVALKCLTCDVGLLVKNPGRAMITKSAKTKVIEAALWQRMTLGWDRNFPSGSY